MNIALIGYGKMGKEIARIAPERRIKVKTIISRTRNSSRNGITKNSLRGVDVCIDFSVPHAAVRNIEAVAACGINLVVGTTGWYKDLARVRGIVRKNAIGLVYSPNFSPGMNLFAQIVEEASKRIDKLGLYDVALGEIHHRMKADSPSGTALMLAQLLMKSSRSKRRTLSGNARGTIKPAELHISSTRVGSVAGIHKVLFDSEADSIELIHSAKSRAGFALGALLAAEWVRGKQGIFTMDDVLRTP